MWNFPCGALMHCPLNKLVLLSKSLLNIIISTMEASSSGLCFDTGNKLVGALAHEMYTFFFLYIYLSCKLRQCHFFLFLIFEAETDLDF